MPEPVSEFPVECPHCKEPVEAMPHDAPRREGFTDWEIRLALRWFHAGQFAFVHHFNCGVAPLIDPDQNWIACSREAPIDIDAVFDPLCPGCELRWQREGGPLWNSDDPQVLARVSRYNQSGYTDSA